VIAAVSTTRRRRERRTHLGAPVALAAILALATSAAAVPAVFDGDPTDDGGQPLIVLPGVPFVSWGPDKKWGTADDVISPSIVGDIDVVVRAGGAYVPGSGVILPPAAGIAQAPAVSAGGLQFPLAGNEVPYQIILSDGAASPAAGHPLDATDLDGRGTLVLAYADLDGDGILGPTNGDPAGSADNALESQEALMLVGRRLALLQGGVSSGGLGVTLGLPASTGGLGLVIAAGAITGSTPPLYKDGPWIATLLPAMWPLDPDKIIGGENAAPPDPIGLVDLEIELEQLFHPAPAHPVLGTPYAIPLDGSSVTNDLVRALSGAATTVTFARELDPTQFVPDPGRRVLPAIATGGARKVVEPVFSVSLADDGPGNGIPLAVFPADSLGNQADPPQIPGGSRIDLVASANLRIVSPDLDGDPQREALPLGAAELATVVIDDAGGADDGGGKGRLFATLDGATAGALNVTLGAGGATGALSSASAVLRFSPSGTTDRLSLRFDAEGDPTVLDPSTHDLTIVVRDERGRSFFTRTFPAGLLQPSASGRVYRYKDPSGVAIERVLHAIVRRRGASPTRHSVRLALKGVDLSQVDRAVPSIAVEAAFGTTAYEASLTCVLGAGGGTSRCKP
jgi:hypothetical protein